MLNFLKRNPYFYYPPVPLALDLRARLPRRNIDKLTVLNVSVGSMQSGLMCQLPFFDFLRLDNIDIHLPYLVDASKITWAAKRVNFIEADVRNFNFDNYDYVLMFDVLEHLPKNDSLIVMDSIRCKQVIFIPLEKKFRENTFGAKSQDHLSLWTEDDFKFRGYQTQVLKNFHHEGGETFDALWALK